MNPIVLMYHDIGVQSGFQNSTAFKYKVAADRFESHLKTIRKWADKYTNQEVILTFDDGGDSFITTAAPLLEQYGFKGIFFIATSYINSPGFLSESEVSDLEKRGHTVGLHSHTHPEDMSKLNYEEILYEWSTSQRVLSNILGHKIDCASIPNGFSSKKVIKAMEESSIKYIYTSEPSTNICNLDTATIIGRYVIVSSDNDEKVLKIVSSESYRILLHTRSTLLGLAKNILGPLYFKIREILIK